MPLGSTEIKGGSHPRDVHQGFWAFLNGNGLPATYGALFFDGIEDDLPFPPPHISSQDLAEMIRHLPSKSICDALLGSFLVRVYPIYPLMDPSTFIPQYSLMWQSFASGSSPLPPALVKDRTYFCLVWAILYVGASVHSSIEWESTAALKGLDQLATTKQIKTDCARALTVCQHTDHPTIHSLTASIIAYHFDTDKLNRLGRSLFTTTTLRIAQSMGLHLPTESRQLDASTENRRRIWWHIAWMDLQMSIEAGLPVCLNAESIYTYPMISDLRHKTSTQLALDTPANALAGDAAPESSIVLLRANGSFQTVKLQYQMISLFQHASKMQLKDIRSLVMCTKDYISLMNEIIAEIPMRGIPERGMMPATLAAASPHTRPDLYEDLAKEPTMLGAFARVDLSLWKLETVIILQHLLLPDLKSTSIPCLPWNRVVRLCVRYLQCYLQLFRVPAFAPYSYSWLYYHGPRRCAFLILHYLDSIHTRRKYRQEMLFCVDEFIDSWCRESRVVYAPVQSESALSPMKVIIKMRESLKIRKDKGRHIYHDPNNPTNPTASDNPESSKDHLEELFDKEYWASLE